MYYVEESHPAIVEKDMWEAVQLEMDRRNYYMERHGVKQLDFVKVQDNPFTGRVVCGECGSAFGRKTWNSTDEDLKRRIWQCNRRYEKKGEVRCGNKHVDVDLYFRMMEWMTVFGEGKVVVSFLDEAEVEYVIEDKEVN